MSKNTTQHVTLVTDETGTDIAADLAAIEDAEANAVFTEPEADTETDTEAPAEEAHTNGDDALAMVTEAKGKPVAKTISIRIAAPIIEALLENEAKARASVVEKIGAALSAKDGSVRIEMTAREIKAVRTFAVSQNKAAAEQGDKSLRGSTAALVKWFDRVAPADETKTA